MRQLLTPFMMIVLIAALALPAPVRAQSAVRDSLLKLLPAAKENAAKINLYFHLGDAIQDTDGAGAREYFNQALLLSNKLYDTANRVRALQRIGATWQIVGNSDSLLFYAQQSLPLAVQIKDSLLIGTTLFNIGIAYRDLSDYPNATDYMLRGRGIMEAKGDKNITAQLNDALLVLYHLQSDYKKAIPFGEKAVQLARELKDKHLMAQCIINLSMTYTENGDLDKAIACLKEGRQLGIDLEDIRIRAYVLMNWANVAIKTEDFQQVKKLSEEGLPLQRKIGAEDAEATVLRALAICYLMEKNYVRAKEYIDQSLAITGRIHNLVEDAASRRVRSAIYYATGDMLNGLRAGIKSDSILDKMVTGMVSERSANLEKKYETEKKEGRIKELEAEKEVHELTIRQKNIQNYILIGSATVLLIFFLLLYRNYKQKQILQQQRISELETEKRLTATEAVLRGEEQERTRLARELHDGLGGMLSGIKYSFKTMQGNLIMTPDNVQAFERSMDMLDSSIKEMRRVAHNMMPEALVKFGLDAAIRDFCNDITKSGALQVNYVSLGLENMIIDQTIAITIYRIVQELLNNTMKHAGAKTAIVQVLRADGQLAVTVEDDGKGFDTQLLDRLAGIGWSNIRNRVEFLKGQLNIQSESGKGTSVHIEFPS